MRRSLLVVGYAFQVCIGLAVIGLAALAGVTAPATAAAQRVITPRARVDAPRSPGIPRALARPPSAAAPDSSAS
jgi:hypothetical protein